MSINPETALYIKLGEGGRWEEECIQRNQTLHLGYNDVPHGLCRRGDWDAVKEFYMTHGSDQGAATRHINQIRFFYESGADALWVTFFANKLWWCFSEPKVTRLPDASKTRPVIGRWSCHDLEGNDLDMSRLSGKLLTTQGFQGTICTVKKQRGYLVRKINGLAQPGIEEAKDARKRLAEALIPIIRDLHWRDFEVLIDLIFRQAGWNRVGALGDTQKTLDLDLITPLTGERFGVQIKSQADLATFERYQQDFAHLEQFTGLYFVVHTPSSDLAAATPAENVTLLLPAGVAELAVRYGLHDWVIDKAG